MTTQTACSDTLVSRPEHSSFSAGDWQILAGQWYPVARAQDIADHPVAVQLLDVKLVVWRTALGVSVARDLCPHRGVPLSKGKVAGDELVCAYHGLRFGADGACRRIPAQPTLKPSDRFRLTMPASAERYGLIWVCLAPGAGAEIAPMPTWVDPAHQALLPPPVDIHGSAGRQTEGFVDVAHFAFVHHEAFADPDRPEVPAYDTTITEFGLRSEYVSTVSNYPKGMQHLAPPDFLWRRVFEVYPPFVAKLTVHFPNDGVLTILNAASPITATSTRLFVPITRNFDTTGSIDAVFAFNAQVFAEDKAIVESQWPQALPLDPAAEAHFAADRTSVAYRKLLREMGLRFD